MVVTDIASLSGQSIQAVYSQAIRTHDLHPRPSIWTLRHDMHALWGAGMHRCSSISGHCPHLCEDAPTSTRARGSVDDQHPFGFTPCGTSVGLLGMKFTQYSGKLDTLQMFHELLCLLPFLVTWRERSGVHVHTLVVIFFPSAAFTEVLSRYRPRVGWNVLAVLHACTVSNALVPSLSAHVTVFHVLRGEDVHLVGDIPGPCHGRVKLACALSVTSVPNWE